MRPGAQQALSGNDIGGERLKDDDTDASGPVGDAEPQDPEVEGASQDEGNEDHEEEMREQARHRHADWVTTVVWPPGRGPAPA